MSGDANDSTLRANATIQVDGSVDGGQLHAEQTIVINGSVGAADLNSPKIVIDSPTVNASALDCEGELQISGAVDAKRIAASEVHLTGDSVTVKAIAATGKVVLGPGVMKIDVVIAPEVDIHPDTTGRITVIESENISNVGAVKGGFSLAEYEDLFGDSTQFLQERGVHASGASVALSVEDEAPAEAEVQPKDSASAVVEDGDSVEPPTEEVDEADEEIIEIVADAVEQADDNDDLHAQLISAVKKITSCYEGAEAPDAIHDLQKLIDAKDYENLRTNITEVWNGLLGFHQTKGIRPHHQVTHEFKVIHGLLQKTS